MPCPMGIFFFFQSSDIFMIWAEMPMLWLCLRISVSGTVRKKRFQDDGSEGRGWGGGGRHWCRLPLKHSSGAVFQQQPGGATHTLVLDKSQWCESWTRSRHNRLILLHLVHARREVQAQAWVLSRTAWTVCALLQAAEKSGSEKLLQADCSREDCTDLLRRDFLKVNLQLMQSVDSKTAADEPVADDKALAPGYLSLSWKLLPPDRNWLNYSWTSLLPFIIQHRKAIWHPCEFVSKHQATADEYQNPYLYMMRVMWRAR